ncbi:MAG: hypothetical protein KBG20_20860 [Caldilineaceae bacterium]|nr:hypothetical protein [Caldilineaceae bacterium]MBP8109862.1 hypothetical protein [Caldilineaceae bacterium]MBP8125023.1 hypothetical protein [Caldilineaceae bacterium]MBP9074772.1 hypothetical protein [Caldilineaceae bacterium]
MRTKNFVLSLTLILLLTVLAACGNSQPETATTTSAAAATSALSESYTDALPLRTQLIVGTLQLEGTDQAVTQEQARTLLPLWQGSSSLQRTGTGAQEEVVALLAQIEGSMTPAQIDAIKQMQLTRTILQETAQSFGLVTGGDGTGTGPGATGQRGTGAGTGQSQRSGPNTSEMLLDELMTVLQNRLQ